MLTYLRLPRQQLGRDLIGTIAPFTGFLILMMLAEPSALASVLAAAKDARLTTMPIALAAYATVGYFAGKIVGALGVTLTRWAAHLPRIGRKYSYACLYEQHRMQIEELYESVFTDGPRFHLSLSDKVNALKSYFTAMHPEGSAAAVRQYMLVDITRAAFVYGAALLVQEALAGLPHPWLMLLCAAIVVIAALATPRRIQKVVRMELVYLVAAAQRKADSAKPPPAK